MLYIHKLSDLNIKSAEIECVPIVRDIKLSGFPVSQQKLTELFTKTTVSAADIELIERALRLLGPVLLALRQLLSKANPVHEPVNLNRALQSLNALEAPLLKNLEYARNIFDFQQQFMGCTEVLVNSISRLKTNEEKQAANAEISSCFEKVLRNSGFSFSHQDLIFEAHTGVVRDLAESLSKGYLFHVTLEEELKKLTFADIKKRISAGDLAEADSLEADVRQIKEGVDAAYRLNMHMVEWAIIFLACVKAATSK